MTKPVTFLIVAEIEDQGYVVGSAVDFSIAREQASDLWNLITQTNKPLNELIKYKIAGNALFIEKADYCKTNGFQSVYCVKIESDESVELFILERENLSHAFCRSKDCSCFIDDLLVRLNTIAN